MMKAFVLLTLVGYATASSVTWTSAARTGSLATGATAAQAGNLVFTFTPANAVAGASGTIKITASTKTWETDGASTTCAVTQGGAARNSATVISGTGTIMTVTIAGGVTVTAAATVITCSTNLAALGAAGAVTFSIETSADTDALSGQNGYTINNGEATWTSAVAATGATGATPGNIVWSFTTQNPIAADGTIKLTSSTAIWAADSAATACSSTCAGTANVVKTRAVSGTKTILTATLTDVCAAASAVVLTCTSNIGVNPAAATAITFSLETSGDTVAITGQTGYTINNGKATWTSAVRSDTVANSTAGNFALSFTTQNPIAAGGTIKLTSSQAIWAADAGAVSQPGTTGFTLCGATCAGTAANVTTSTVTGTKTILTSTLSAACAAASAVVLTCTTNLGANPYVVGAAITFDLETSGDTVAVGSGQTGYTITAAPPPPTPTVSSASTATVISTLSFAAVALAAMLQ